MPIFCYYNLIIILILSIILIYFCYKKNKKKKKLRKISNIQKLNDYGEELIQKMKAFWRQKTIVNFKIKKINANHEQFDSIFWENHAYDLNTKFMTFEIAYQDMKDKNDIIIQKALILRGKKNREFLIDIYLHQINNYELFIDYNEISYSLESIFFSFNNKSLPKKIKINEIDLSLDNFNFSDRLISTIINIDKEQVIKFMNQYCNLKVEKDNPIFNNNNKNLLLNNYISKKRRTSSLFINEKEKVLPEINDSDIKLLNDFYNRIMIPFALPYKKYNPSKITFSLQKKFAEEFQKFLGNNNYYNEQKTKNDSSNYINKSSEDIILKMNDILLDTKKKNQTKIIEKNNPEDGKNEEEEEEEEEESSDDSESIKLQKLKQLLEKFFDVPFHKIYLYNKNSEIFEKICYLHIIINTNYDFSKLILFLNTQEKLFKNAFNLDNKEKIKLSFAICNHLIEDDIKGDDIELIEMYNLPENSPYFEGEIMYRNIIKRMTEKSKIRFIFLQLNSGAGFNFIKNEKCYKIKMLPLDSIKYHLLSNNTEYLLRFWNKDSGEISCIDSYTNIESVNEALIFGENSWSNKSIAYKKNTDNSIKFCLVQFHEKGGHEKFDGNKKMEDSPRHLINLNLNIYDNFDENNDKGESGHAIDHFLYGNKEYIFRLLNCKDLKDLSNIDLFIGEKTLPLKREKKKILKKNGISIKVNRNIIKNIRKKKNVYKINTSNMDRYTFSKLTYYQKGIFKLY